MFTGIIRHLGVVKGLFPRPGGRELHIEGIPEEWKVTPGESIAVHGVCLTLERFEKGLGVFFLGEETLKVTTLGGLMAGSKVHLEPSLTLNQYLGGDLFLGHVDGIGIVEERIPRGENLVLRISAPPTLCGMIFPKGSIAINGVSLTVNEEVEGVFSVCLIPETLRRTCLGELHPGSPVNLEADKISRQIAWVLKERLPHVE